LSAASTFAPSSFSSAFTFQHETFEDAAAQLVVFLGRLLHVLAIVEHKPVQRFILGAPDDVFGNPARR